MIKNNYAHKDSFTFCFTHVPNNFSLEDLFSKLLDCFNKMAPTEKRNEGFVNFMKNLVEKTKEAINR